MEKAKPASKAIANKFCDRMPEEMRAAFKFNVLCALETEQMRKVFISVKEVFVKEVAEEASLPV
jgi:hypothetical protein